MTSQLCSRSTFSSTFVTAAEKIEVSRIGNQNQRQTRAKIILALTTQFANWKLQVMIVAQR